MTTVALPLPAGGPVVGMVVITAAAVPGADRAQFTVSAVITGGRPGTAYYLTGNDCSDAAPLPDHMWATGLAGANGTAGWGHPWTGAVADRYCLALAPSPASPPPGLRGQFALERRRLSRPARHRALHRRDTPARRSLAGPDGLPTARAFSPGQIGLSADKDREA